MIKILKKNWKFVLILFVLLGLSVGVRLINLTKIPVFADEAIYVRWSQVMRAEQTLRFLPLSDGKQPLYMWLVIPFFKVFSDPLFAGRFVSIMSGIGTLLGIITLSYLLFKNKTVTVVAALFYALSPFTFFFDRLALADSLLSMFGIWTFIFAYLAVSKQRLDFAMLTGFALGGAWLTKSPALFFTLMLPVFWLFAPWKKEKKENLLVLGKTIFFTLVAAAIGYGFYNILRLGPNFHLIASRNMDYVYPVSHIFERPFDPLKTFIIASFKWYFVMGPISLLVLGVTGTISNIKKSWKVIAILLFWFLVPLVIQCEFAKTLTARYILYPLPYLMILAASFFVIKKNLFKKIGFLFVILFVVQSSIFVYNLITNPERANLPRVERSGYLEEWTAGQGIKETADYLINEEKNNPNEQIVIGTEGYFGTLPDGLQMYLNDHPRIVVIGVGLNFDKLPNSLYESKKAGNKTYLLANTSRYYGDPEEKGLTLIAEYPKAEKPNGTHESLLLFEVTNVESIQK